MNPLHCFWVNEMMDHRPSESFKLYQINAILTIKLDPERELFYLFFLYWSTEISQKL